MNDWYQYSQQNVQQTLTLHPSVCFVRLHPAVLAFSPHSSGGSLRHQIRRHFSNHMSPISNLAFTEDAFGLRHCITRMFWLILKHTSSYTPKTTCSLEKHYIYFPIFSKSVPYHCCPSVGSYLD